MEPLLEFDPDVHEYRLDGLRIPSCTEILRESGACPGFAFLSADELAFYQSRGQSVHRAIELSIRGELDRRTLDRKETKPYVEGWTRFVRDHKVTVLELNGQPFTEIPLCHNAFLFGATPDVVIRIGSNSGVCELKATSSHHPATTLQTAGQLLAVRQVMPKIGTLRLGLRLLKTEPYYDLRYHTERSDESVFLGMLSRFNWLTKHKLLKQNGGR